MLAKIASYKKVAAAGMVVDIGKNDHLHVLIEGKVETLALAGDPVVVDDSITCKHGMVYKTSDLNVFTSQTSMAKAMLLKLSQTS
jgi:hypothetical protein